MKGVESTSPLLSGRILAASALWSLSAQTIPAVAGVVTIPFIVRGLGVERFGVLTLAWMVIGYFGLFDLGLGRAVTKFAAEFLASAKHADIERMMWTALYLMLALGLVGAFVLTALVPWLVGSAIKIPPELRAETSRSFYLLALSIPIVILSAGFRGLLEGAQRFKLTSFVKIPTGVLTFVAPLLVLPFTRNLAAIVLVLFGIRFVGAIVYAVICHRVIQPHGAPARLDGNAARTLLSFGAWMTVSNVVSPLMVSMDRFFVGAFISLAAVSYYATPFEAVTKLLIVPSAITAVLFPAFSAAAVADRGRMERLFRVGTWTLLLTMYPVVFLVMTFAPELLRLWLGGDFAAQSSVVLRWLAVGVLMNSMASSAFALLQGVGRSDTTAKIHLGEAPLYLLLMFWLIREYGINGAAMAWCARTTVDMTLLYWFAGRQLRTVGRQWFRDIALFTGLTVALGSGLLLQSPLRKLFLTSTLAILVVAFAWHWTLASGRRAWIVGLLRNR